MCLCVHKVLFPWALFPTICCSFSCLSTEHSSASLMCLFGIYSLEVEGCLFVCLLFLAGGRILLSYCSIWRTICSLYLTHPLLFVGFFPSDLIYFESFCVENGVWCCVYLFFFLFLYASWFTTRDWGYFSNSLCIFVETHQRSCSGLFFWSKYLAYQYHIGLPNGSHAIDFEIR